MEALILCEHNWSFVKLRSVHTQIVRKQGPRSRWARAPVNIFKIK